MISILLPDLRGGGAERVNLDLAHEFARQGHTVEFVLMRAEGELLPEAKAAFSVLDLETSRARQVPLALARYLRKRRPDVLLAAMWPLTVLAPLGRAISGHRCKLLVSEHAILSAQYLPWGRLHRTVLRTSMAIGYRMADARIGVSSGVVDDIARLAKMPTTDFHAIHNPLASRPPPSSQAQASADSLWSVLRGARLLTVGSFKAVKNHTLLLHAFAGMNRPDARLMFVGTGAGEANLRALAMDLGVANRVIFAGFHPDPTPFYQTADLFVLSSDYEGFGNVIVEALACGLPVVSTDCPSGPAEILEQGNHGRLVPVGDADALTTAMQAALADPGDPVSRKRRADDFAPEIAARRYLELLGTR
jgi:glycosyltransferase involved in cell wall biosynthesis